MATRHSRTVGVPGGMAIRDEARLKREAKERERERERESERERERVSE